MTFTERFMLNFIDANRYMYLVNGLGVTVTITIGATVLGLLLGCIIAIMKLSSWELFGVRIPNVLANIYIDIIRGTPVLVQLMIMYFLVFGSINAPLLVAILAFGINSGAYVAEIVRAGILAVDKGQTEAGRSLGLSSSQTMKLIIMPQAIKNILPALVNEFIVLFKETSIVGYIAIADLTKGADIIRSRTFDAFFPLLAIALIYFVITTLLSRLLSRVERRLRQSDIR